jgi:hypothetical protein
VHPESTPTDSTESLSGTKVLTNLAQAALTDRLAKADVDALLSQMLSYLAGEQSLALLKDIISLSPARLAQAWQSTRGRQIARHRDVPWADFIRLPSVLFVSTMFEHAALPPEATEDQRTVVWQLMDDVYTAYFITGQISGRQAIPLLTTWKGITNVFGWGGLAPNLEPKLRGPTAYLMGFRFERLNNRPAAIEFFRTALADAPPGSLLARLAQAELDRLAP